MPLRNAHELWTKLQDKYEVSNIIEDDCCPSTSDHDELTYSSTSPTCDLSQGNDMVSGDRNCIVDGESTIDYTSSLSHCNDLSTLTISLPCVKTHVGEVEEDVNSSRPEVEGEQSSSIMLDTSYIS